MRNRTGITLVATLVVALTVASVATANPPSWRDHFSFHPEALATSGEFTGTLDGQISLGTDTYRLAPNVAVYEIGVGPLPAGSVITNRHVFLLGQNDLVTMVIVRPASDSWADRGDLDSQTHILSDDTPQ